MPEIGMRWLGAATVTFQCLEQLLVMLMRLFYGRRLTACVAPLLLESWILYVPITAKARQGFARCYVDIIID